MRRLAAIAALLFAIAAFFPALPENAGAAVPVDETFEGASGGGTISITTTQARTKVRRIEIENVTYPAAAESGCGATINVVRHFDPPVSVGGSGSFNATLIPADSGVLTIDLVSVNAQVSGSTISGSSSFSASTGQPEQGCFSDPVAFTATGPVDTPPDGSETLFAGTVTGYAGLIEIHQEFGGGITSVGLDAVTGPCGAAAAPVDARDFFEPLLPQAPGTGAFTAALQFSSSNFSELRKVTLDGTQPDANTLTGTMTVQTFVPSCTDSASWTAARIAGVGGLTQLPSVESDGPARSTMPIVLGAIGALFVAVVLVSRVRGRPRVSS